MFLAIASGSSDVIAFLLLGHVFASAMTGNTALLGIALASGNLLSVTQPLCALLGFAAGVALATLIYNRYLAQDPKERVAQILLALEILFLALFALILEFGLSSAGQTIRYVLILLGSMAMGIQGVAARQLNAPGVNTIVFTTTLVTIVSTTVGLLSGRVKDSQERSNTLFQISALSAYGGGAMLAGFLYWTEFSFLPWLPAAAVLVVMLRKYVGAQHSDPNNPIDSPR